MKIIKYLTYGLGVCTLIAAVPTLAFFKGITEVATEVTTKPVSKITEPITPVSEVVEGVGEVVEKTGETVDKAFGIEEGEDAREAEEISEEESPKEAVSEETISVETPVEMKSITQDTDLPNAGKATEDFDFSSGPFW